jgi:hypothetical protein
MFNSRIGKSAPCPSGPSWLASASRTVRRRLLGGTLALPLACLIALTSCDGPKVPRTDFSEYLAKHDPVMKSKRDEIIESIRRLNEQLEQLKALQNTYKTPRAQALAQEQRSRLAQQTDYLQNLLNRIDEDIEVAIVAGEISSADGGGLFSAETSELIKNADQILLQSSDLSQEISGLFSGNRHSQASDSSPPPDQFQSSRAETSRSRQTNSEPVDRTVGDRESPVSRPSGIVPEAVIPVAERREAKPTDLWANLRAEPSADARIVFRVEKGQRFWVGKRHPDFDLWYRVNTMCGKIGWMNRVAIQFEGEPPPEFLSSDVASTATDSTARVVLRAGEVSDSDLDGAKIDEAVEWKQAIPLSTHATVRMAPDISSTVLDLIPSGQIFMVGEVSKEKSSWYQVTTDSGASGWVLRGTFEWVE